MNQRKAMPAKGMSARARVTSSRRSRSLIHVPASTIEGGAAECSSTSTPLRMSPKTRPATAADLGARTAWATGDDSM